ncbi:unnamed protein product, partial [Phaeothamnion confervicola]
MSLGERCTSRVCLRLCWFRQLLTRRRMLLLILCICALLTAAQNQHGEAIGTWSCCPPLFLPRTVSDVAVPFLEAGSEKSGHENAFTYSLGYQDRLGQTFPGPF